MADEVREDKMGGAEKAENKGQVAREKDSDDDEDDIYEVEKIVGTSVKDVSSIKRDIRVECVMKLS